VAYLQAVNWPWTRESRQSSLSEPTQDLLEALGGSQVIAGERVNVTTSLAITDVYAAVTTITETVATLPFKVYRTVGGDPVETPDHRAAAMLGQAPNSIQPAHRFWSTIAGHLLLWGNAFVEKLRDQNGLVSELYILHPGCIRVEYNSSLRQKRYVVTDEYGLNEKALSDDRVLHIYGFSVDGICGMSPITQARQQLGLAKARERFEGEVYAKKPFLTGVINHPGQMKDTVKLRESWAAVYGGGDKGLRGQPGRHGVAVLEEGATFSPLTAPLADMEFVASQQLSKTTIANIFHLPPSYIGGSVGDSLTYQTVEGNRIQFATQAITPLTVNIQKFVGSDRGIFPFPSWYPEFSLQALMRGDSAARSAFYQAMSTVAKMTPNEIRGLENMPPIQGGDQVAPAPALPVGTPTPAAGATPPQGAAV
jgi:HK97 family phage portal protein